MQQSETCSELCLSVPTRVHDDMSTMVYIKEDKLEKLTQDEIISKTKQVIQGLEALKNEHNSILQSLLETLKCLKKEDESNLVEEKSSMIRKSLEMLELGLSEAQVRTPLRPRWARSLEAEAPATCWGCVRYVNNCGFGRIWILKSRVKIEALVCVV